MALPTIFFSYIIANLSSLFYIAESNTKDFNEMGYLPERKKIIKTHNINFDGSLYEILRFIVNY